MVISIKRIRPATNQEWDHIWQNCDYATFFHSREWAEIWQAYTNQAIRPGPRIVEFSDRIKVLLPLSYRPCFRGLLKEYVSSPAGTYGGWISDNKVKIEHSQLLTDYLSSRIGSIVWRLNPYDPLIFKCTFRHMRDDETHSLDLKEGFDGVCKLWAQGNKNIQRKVRKAHKEGVRIRKVSDPEDWNDYYRIYQDSLRRWRDKASASYHWEIFKIMKDLKSKNIELWLATYKEKNIAGALCLYHSNHAVYWHGAALSDYFQLRPVNLLMYEIIKDACQRKAKWFDFNPSGGHEGVKKFKQSFRAGSLKAPVVSRTANAKKILSICKAIVNPHLLQKKIKNGKS
jgi:hypothetical protein